MRFILLLLTALPLINMHAAEVRSGVYHWDLLPASTKEGWLERPIFKGNTLDLVELNAFAITLPVSSETIKSLGSDAMETLFIVKEGKLRLSLDGKESVLSPGSVAILHPKSNYQIENADKIPATFYALRFRSKPGFKKDPKEKGNGSFAVDWDSLEYRPSDIGGRRDNFDTPTAMMNRFELHTSTLNAGLTNHRAHTHRAEEMVLVLKGKVEMLIGDNYYTASEGDLYFIEADILHSLRNVGDTETVYFAFQWM